MSLFTPGYLFEVVFVKCVCIRRTSVFFQFYGVLSGVIYNYSSPIFVFDLFTPGSSPAYLSEVVFVKGICIWRTSVFFQFYGAS